jgi:WD40 repeat protein
VAVAWNPARPDVVATGGCDDTAYVWRVGQDAFEESAGSLGTAELTGHTDTVAALGFNASGTLLATAGMDGALARQDCAQWRMPGRGRA